VFTLIDWMKKYLPPSLFVQYTFLDEVDCCIDINHVLHSVTDECAMIGAHDLIAIAEIAVRAVSQ
jgi:hypothetical protein